MDLSVNKISNNQLNFKGVKGEFNRNNVPVFKFNAPPYDKEKESVVLEFALLDFDEYKNDVLNPFKSTFSEIPFEDDKPLRIAQEAIQSKAFAYRYKIIPKNLSEKPRYFTDAFEKIKTVDTKEEYNVVRLSDTYKIDSKKGSMRHSFLDADAILDLTGKLDIKDKHKPRNHFNKLGGSTKGLIELLKTGELNPYRYIISTPDIGNDPTSSHRYWPNNLYQCQNMQDFKDLNYELFKKGKGYVADGAFTDQSLQSPLFQHVLKWGKKSPFYNMFKLDGSNRVILGVLPNDIKENEDNAYKHIGIRIVNNPYSNSYDENKPILFQLYDNRLSSYEQRNDTTKLIDAYDSQPKDIFEITHNDDSVYPFYFEADPVNLPDVKEKIDLFKERNAISLNDINEKMGLSKFLDFGSFVIAPDRHHASNATFWDGNRDIVKLNLSNPKDFSDGKISDANRLGMLNARKYLYGVAKFHTEGIQNYLILKSAKLDHADRLNIAKANNVENFNEILKGENLIHPILEKDRGIGEYIKTFPLQSLETSPELSAVFAQPQFNPEFLKDGTQLMLYDYIDNVIEDAMLQVPQKDREAYKIYVTKTCSNDILRHILAYALNPMSIDSQGNISLRELSKVTLKSLAPNAKSPEEERAMVIKSIKDSLKDVDLTAITNKYTRELKNVSLKDFKEAETLIIQSNAGLNWRFDAAKDIGDLDSVRAGKKDFKDIWDDIDGVTQFWHDFIKTVKEYNPSSYVIAELTDLWSFYNDQDIDIMTAFDKNGVRPDKKENNFLIEIGATTNSNYGQYFNKLSCFIGTNPENSTGAFGNDPIERSGNLGKLRSTVKEFISSSQPSTALLTHEFFDNHDKPRLLHCLPLNMKLFLCGTDNRAENLNDYTAKLSEDDREEFKDKVKEVTGRQDFARINPMALAVGFMMFDEINKTNYDEEDKEKLKAALKELVNGQKNVNSLYNYKRAKSFGTKPYEITIREMFERAGIDENIDDKVKDFHSSMLKPSMEYLERLWQVMNAIVGTPTLFNGTEFAQTGYETLNKNVYVDNRNQILHGLKKDKRYKDLYNRMYAASNLYNQPQMSAIRDGFPVLCKVYPYYDFGSLDIDKGKIDYFINQIQNHGGMNQVEELFINGKIPSAEEIKDKLGIGSDHNNPKKLVEYYQNGILEKYYNFIAETKDAPQVLPIFKYDDKGSEVLSIISNNGIPHNEWSHCAKKAKFDPDMKIKSIALADDNNISPIPDGTNLKKKVYKNGKYENEKNEAGEDIIYTVEKGVLKRKDGEDINIDNTVVNFFVDKIIPAQYSPYNKIN